MAGIYIHIPFCRSKCIYCDFYSSTLEEKEERYIQALCSELAIRKNYLQQDLVKTIYLGGGTPSLLSKQQLEQIKAALIENFDLRYVFESTIEANPDDLSKSYLEELKELGFNRLSIGVQTFQDNLLKFLKRRHSSSQVIDAIANAQDVGFDNISIDLIYGLPGQTYDSWQEDVEKAINTNVTHISAYSLTYESGTYLHRLVSEKKVAPVEDEQYLKYYKYLVDRLQKAGFIHYEVSNFCRPGMYSRHNSSYWSGAKYLGCGPSAHSYNGSCRQWNISSINKYIYEIENNDKFYTIENLSNETQYNDYIITSLRTTWGLDTSDVKHKFGQKIYEYCTLAAQKYINDGLLILKNDRLTLSEQGIFISDGIMSDLLWVD